MEQLRRVLVTVLTAILVSSAGPLLWAQEARAAPKEGVRQFNFAPEKAPDVPGFVKVSGKSVYDKKVGYGWANLEGELQTGMWERQRGTSWEYAGNLNLASRYGPDDLARSYASGPATFALDLQPGKYEVWVLSGDWGLLEYIPREPYKIMVEGATAYDFKMTAEEFYREFETPVLEDDLTQTDVWRRYVEPRFKWSSVVVDVTDGQLNVNVEGGRRDLTVFNYVGDYAITETRSGPKVCFTGALNALVVMPAGQDAVTGLQEIDRIDRWRQQDFAKKWPLRRGAKTELEPPAADLARGYTVYFPNPLRPVRPEHRDTSTRRTISLRATPGEYVPVTFAVYAVRDMGRTTVSVSHLSWFSEAASAHHGNASLIPFAEVKTGVVRYVAKPVGRRDPAWQPGPDMIVPTDSWDIRGDLAKQFWLTIHVPEEVLPVKHSGTITLKPEKAPPTKIDLELQVLPFRLERPTHLAIGMTYFSPLQYSYFAEERFWKRMEAEFADMRRHNMTSIQYTGIRMDDYDRMDKAFALYRKAGFEQPVNLLESYGAMCRLRRNGIPWETEQFHTEYVDFVRKFLDEAKRRNWPPIIIDFGDEFTNSAQEEFGAKLARNLKKIPDIVTGADSNGYKEVTLMAPEVDIVAFNNGWDGPKGVNRGKRLLKKETVDLIKKAGATPWLVNIAKDRFSNGYWLWKMVRLGIRGKMEWMYRSYNGMPWNSFDAKPMRGHLVYPGPNGTAVPTLRYEWMRMGLDDLAYLYTLEKTVEEARKDPARKAAVAKADAFIRELDGMIEDDMNKYRGKDRSKYVWPVERYDEVRNQVIDLILELRGTN